jgi:hypothetical protein
MNQINWIRIIGFILLIPPLLSVPLFIMDLFTEETGGIASLSNLSDTWMGRIDYDRGGGGFTSAVPFYLGSMAIAGALLLRSSNKAV